MIFYTTTNFAGGINIVWGLSPHSPPPTQVGGFAATLNYQLIQIIRLYENS